MTNRREAEAHALSLHIYSILEQIEKDGLERGMRDLDAFLNIHRLKEHFDVKFKDCGVGLVSKTEFGDNIVLELYSRCEFSPCPSGKCPYALNSFCKWCGKLRG